jgi:peptidoglycan hydrolase-like amidase
MAPRSPILLLGAAALCAASVLVAAPASAAPGLVVDPKGSIHLDVMGNGHGHGMSQYGARGAAIAGLSYHRIVHFYYPHTHLTTLGQTDIRVLLSNTGSTTTVGAYPHLTVTGVSGQLPWARVDKYRLIAGKHDGLKLQQLNTGGTWKTKATGLPNGARFHRTNHYSIRLYLADGSSTRYAGSLASYRSSSGGVYTVNGVSLDRYTAGVVPREMPASWQRAAVRAQAVAARTYGRYAVLHPQSSTYDICDTTMCQVYGGHVHYYSAGNQAWTDDIAAVRYNSNKVLTYHGAVIFAQFSASDGGYTTDGGQPYLIAERDPYDNAASGDPYLGYERSSSASTIAAYFGLRKVTGLTITKRDGHGAWGGRVLAAEVKGTDAAGHARTVHATGFDMEYAFGLGSTLFKAMR